MIEKLAINGGKTIKNKFSPYKTIGKEEISAANKVLKSEFYQVLRHQKSEILWWKIC